MSQQRFESEVPMPGTSQWPQGFLPGSSQPRIVLQFSNASSASRLLPNPSLNYRTPNGGLSWPGLAVRDTFSPARAKPSRRRVPVGSNVRQRRAAPWCSARHLRPRASERGGALVLARSFCTEPGQLSSAALGSAGPIISF